MVMDALRKRSGDPFFARAAVLNSGSSASGTTVSPPCDAIYVGSTNASGLICTFAQGTAAVTLPASMATGIYPFSLSAVSSGGGASGMNIVFLYTGSTSNNAV